MTPRHSSENSIIQFVTNRENDVSYTQLFDKLLRESEYSRWAVAFIRQTGVTRFTDAINEARRNGAKIRCLTSFDFQQTQKIALLDLIEKGVEIKLAAPGWGTYHPKMYLFSAQEIHHALIGSANLTGGAFEQNIETGVHITGGKILGEMGAFFADHWNDARTITVTEELLTKKDAIPDTWKYTADSDHLLLEYQEPKSRKPKSHKTLLQRIHSVMKPGETYSIKTVTKLVIEKFPDWDFGLTPDASIRRDLNYNSTRHPDTTKSPLFAVVPGGKYRRL